MSNMRPGNSVTHICVVAVDEFAGSGLSRMVRIAHFSDYERSVNESNLLDYSRRISPKGV
jgi:hypothetical protein